MIDVQKCIGLDYELYWNFGSDQAYIDFPVRFPTVTIALLSTVGLTRAVDEIRVREGHLPMLPIGTDESGEYDQDGWYNFYVSLNGFNDTKIDNCIEAIVQSSEADDNEECYYVPLTEAEQIEVYNEINKLLQKYADTSCDKLLEEARAEMIKLEQYREKIKEDMEGSF